jgi:cytochrome c peroxidase
MKGRVFIVFIVVVFVGCNREQLDFDMPITDPELVPIGFPDVESPEDNSYSAERWLLGKKLFFDPIMSEDFSTTCASCHDPSLAFAVNEKVSNGAGGEPGTRNSPSLANVAYHPYYTREGGVPTLERQVLVPIQEHNEFNTNILVIADRMNDDEEYVELSKVAYGRLPDPFVITRAIANFERTLLSGNSRYDRYVYQNEEEALSGLERYGMELFYSAKTSCSECHSGFNFTNYSFENNGLYQIYPDPGRLRLTNDSADIGRFKVPSLRNIELTHPYMHDGSFETISQVLKHYNEGGEGHPNKSQFIRKLNLSQAELQALEAFLITLTDEKFVRNNLFTNE